MTKRSESEYRPGYPATAMGLLTPPVLWACYFVLIYSLHGLVCVGKLESTLISQQSLPVVVTLLSLATMAVHAGVCIWAWKLWRRLDRCTDPSEMQQRARFLASVSAANAGLFLVATLWIGLPSLILEPCV